MLWKTFQQFEISKLCKVQCLGLNKKTNDSHRPKCVKPSPNGVILLCVSTVLSGCRTVFSYPQSAGISGLVISVYRHGNCNYSKTKAILTRPVHSCPRIPNVSHDKMDPWKNLQTVHCQIFFPFLERYCALYHQSDLLRTDVWRNLWDLFPTHSVSNLLEKEASLHQSHCLGFSRYFSGLSMVRGHVPIFHSSLIILTILCILPFIILTFCILTVCISIILSSSVSVLQLICTKTYILNE